MFHKIVDKAEAGDQLGLLLRGVERDQAKRGIVLIPQGSGVKAMDRFEAKVWLRFYAFITPCLIPIILGLHVETGRRRSRQAVGELLRQPDFFVNLGCAGMGSTSK